MIWDVTDTAARLLRRRVEALTAATVPLVTSEPAIEPNVLALLAACLTQAAQATDRTEEACPPSPPSISR